MFSWGKKRKVKKLVQEALSDDELTDDEIKSIENLLDESNISPQYVNKLRKKHFLKIASPIINRIRNNRRFSPDDEEYLIEIAEKLHAALNFDEFTPYRKLWEIEKTGEFDPEPIAVNIRLSKNEECYYSANAVWTQLKTIRKHHGYVGGSVGFRVSKGVTLRLGKAVPSYSETEELVDISDGTLFVTNKKLIFDGERRSTTITYGRLISYQQYSDGIEIRKSSGKPDLFRLNPIDLEFVDALLQVVE